MITYSIKTCKILDIIKSEKGQSLTEFAISLPIIVVFIILVIQLLSVVLAKEEAAMQARTIASYGSKNLDLFDTESTEFYDKFYYDRYNFLEYFDEATHRTGTNYYSGTYKGKNLEIYVEPLLSGEQKEALLRLVEGNANLCSEIIHSIINLDYGYERVRLSLEIEPLPYYRMLRKRPFMVKSDCVLNLSEGIENPF